MPRAVRAALVAVLATAGAAAVTVTSEPAQAATCNATWVGPAGGDWGTAANWSPAAVPTTASRVCVNTTAGPTVAAGYQANASVVSMTNGALTVDGFLTTKTIKLKHADLGGTGRLTATGLASTFAGVLFGGTLEMDLNQVTASGARTMCGSQLSLCLNGGSWLRISGALNLDGATVDGSTTAADAISGPAVIATDGKSNRISVPLEGGVSATGSGSTLRLDDWLAFDENQGIVSSYTSLGNNVLVLPQPIITVEGELITDGGEVRTVAGINALSTLTNVKGLSGGPGLSEVTLPSDVTPQGGTLNLSYGTTLTPTRAPVTVHGKVANGGQLTLQTDLTADTFVGGGVNLAAAASLTAARVVFDHPNNNYVELRKGSSVTATGGLIRMRSVLYAQSSTTPNETCGSLGGNVSLQGVVHISIFDPDATCAALYTATGSFALDTRLELSTDHALPVGTRIVLIDAAGGLQGTFSSVSGQQVPGGHWVVSYTATQAIITLMAN